MGTVYQYDKRSGITYAYENRRIWSEERQKYVTQRKLIGRVINMETKEIAPTDGRCKKFSPYLTEEEKASVTNDQPHEFGPALVKKPLHREVPTTHTDSAAHNLRFEDDTHLVETIEQMAAAIEQIKQDLAVIKERLG